MEIIIIIAIICAIVSWLGKAIESVKTNAKILKQTKEEKKAIIEEKKRIEEEKGIIEGLQSNIERLKEDITQNSPWLAEKMADCYSIYDIERERYLKNKSHPAYKASEVVSEIKEEKKKLLRENKMLNYQIKTLCDTFPFIESFMQEDIDNLQEALDFINQDEIKDDYDTVSNYLTPEEYKKLNSTEKYQLALDRYINKKRKSLWLIGISYERYIGYVFENKGYDVEYTGALKGLYDEGCDLIAENPKEKIVIQCKYWRKERIIRENVVLQLYGSMILKSLDTKKKVKGMLITSTKLSEDAKRIAKALKIEVLENENFNKEYPCIKCNINKSTKERIYHLPFDQQYDKVKMEFNRGEKYVKTVKEAEEYGFRRAMRYYYTNE